VKVAHPALWIAELLLIVNAFASGTLLEFESIDGRVF